MFLFKQFLYNHKYYSNGLQRLQRQTHLPGIIEIDVDVDAKGEKGVKDSLPPAKHQNILLNIVLLFERKET